MPDPEQTATDPVRDAVRVVVQTSDREGAVLVDPVSTTVPLGEQLEIGREGDLQVADDPEDTAVSRVALILKPVAGGVELTVNNLNGVVVHPWGSRTRYLPKGTTGQLVVGRTGIRVVGGTSLDVPDARAYWVLVEDVLPVEPRIPLQRSVVTVQNARPDALTAPQRAAVELIFAEHLAWPPLAAPLALTIDSAARRLGVSPTAVTQRLEGVRKKAYSLGMAQQYGVVDPEYVFALVAHRFLSSPAEPLPAEDIALFATS